MQYMFNPKWIVEVLLAFDYLKWYWKWYQC